MFVDLERRGRGLFAGARIDVPDFNVETIEEGVALWRFVVLS